MDRVTDTAKPYSTANPSFKGGNNENELNPELALKLKSPNSNNKKQLQHTKHFMSPTISAAIKANNNIPKKKILAERNETLDVVEQNSVVRRSSPSLGSKAVKFAGFDACDDNSFEKGLVGNKSFLQPYDPVKNYLSPRPKFLRYNPNRRRKILDLRESDDGCVKISSSFDVGVGDGNDELPFSGLESELGSFGCLDKKESVEESVNETERNEGEDDERDEMEEEEEEDEMAEFGDEKCWSLKGLLKFVFVVLAVVLSTKAICSMNSPDNLSIKESLWGYSNWYGNVYGAASSNVSEVVYSVMREADLLVERLKVGEVYHDYKGVDRVESTEELAEIQGEVENDETNLSNQESVEKMQWAEVLAVQEIAVSEVVDIGNAEVEKEEDGLIELQEIIASEVLEVSNVEAEIEVHDSDQEDADADFEMEESMEEVVENEVVDDIKTATFDPILAVLIGLPILVSMFFVVIKRSKRTKPSSPASTKVVQQSIVAEKEEIKDLEPTPTPSSLVQKADEEEEEPLMNPASLQKDVSKEISHTTTYAPSVELLGEFVFGEEVTSSVKNYNNITTEANGSNSFIQTTTAVSIDQTKSSYMEMSTGDSHTVKKQVRKNAEVSSSAVTPSSVRRSNRLQNRSIKSP